MPSGTFDPPTAIRILLDIDQPGVAQRQHMCCRARVVERALVQIGLQRRIAERTTQHRETAHRIGARSHIPDAMDHRTGLAEATCECG